MDKAIELKEFKITEKEMAVQKFVTSIQEMKEYFKIEDIVKIFCGEVGE